MQYTYKQLSNDGKVYGKIDWATIIFTDCSMRDVLHWIDMDSYLTDFIEDQYQIPRGYDEVIKFRCHEVALETNTYNYYGISTDDISVFDCICKKIRLELSGNALDFLRSRGLNMDTHRWVRPTLPEGATYHFSRVDFAYDFVNYKPEFINQLLEHIRINQLPSGRIPLASTKGAISCKVVTGNQRTVYLGSPQSDSMLRIYDKRMQYVNLTTNTYIKPNPYGNPDSWFRIEWQTRNKVAHQLVLSEEEGRGNSLVAILRLIMDKYSFCDGTVDIHRSRRAVVPFWRDIFDWTELESRIILNENCVEFCSDDDSVVRDFFSRSVRSFLLTYSLLGRVEFERMCNEYLNSLYFSDDGSSSRRLQAFLCRLLPLSICYTIPDEKSSGLWNNFGRFSFSF